MQFRHFIRARRQHWDNTPVTNPDVNIRKNTTTDSLGILFTLFELKRAISNTWQSTPGKNRVCYSILAHLEDSALNTVLRLFSKVCLRNRQNIIAWKQSIIVPVLIPGKHPSDPSSDRPTALTSQLGKTGAHNNRQINLLSIGRRDQRSPHLSGFWKERIWTLFYAWSQRLGRLRQVGKCLFWCSKSIWHVVEGRTTY